MNINLEKSANRPKDRSKGVYLILDDGIEDSSKIGLGGYVKIFYSYKISLAIIVFLFGCTAIGVALHMKPVYKADILLAPVSQSNEKSGITSISNQFGGIASLAGIELDNGGDVEIAIATLRSRAFTEKFIKEENLMPILFSDIWDPVNKVWNIQDQLDEPTMWKAFYLFESIRIVNMDKKTGLINVSIIWQDPEIAATWANKLIEKLNRLLREKALEEGERKLKYLNEQLKRTGVVEMHQSIFRLIEIEMKKTMVANVKDEFAFTVLDPAIAPEDRFRPNRKMIVLFGLLAGFIFGTISILAFDKYKSIKSHQ